MDQGGGKICSGNAAQGKVKNITSFGVYIQLEPGIVGMVHISDLSWTRRIQHPTEIVKIGQDLEVKVIDSKPNEKRIALSVKDTEPNPWHKLMNIYPVGTETEGTLKQMMDQGAIVSLEHDIDCFVPRGKNGHAQTTAWPDFLGSHACGRRQGPRQGHRNGTRQAFLHLRAHPRRW